MRPPCCNQVSMPESRCATVIGSEGPGDVCQSLVNMDESTPFAQFHFSTVISRFRNQPIRQLRFRNQNSRFRNYDSETNMADSATTIQKPKQSDSETKWSDSGTK